MSEHSFLGQHVQVESHPFGVKKMFLTRPDARNAFHAEMIEEIIAALDKLLSIENTLDMRLLVIEGAGSTFCAGADLSYMKEQAQKNETQNLEDARTLAKMFYTLASFPTPVVCAVRGAAIGGGLGLVACADYTLAHENSIFATSEVLLGIVPGVISPYVVRKIGASQGSAFMLTGKKMDAQQALSIHLIHKITTEKEWNENLEHIIQDFLKAGPQAARMTKELIQNCSPLPDHNLRELTTQKIARARVSREGQAGLASFFEKKAPTWCPNETNKVTK